MLRSSAAVRLMHTMKSPCVCMPVLAASTSNSLLFRTVMSHVLRRQGASRIPDCSSNYGYPCSHVLPSATDTQPNWGQQQVHVQPPVKPVVEAMGVSLWFQFRACWPVIGMAALCVCKGPPRSPSRATPATRSHTENPRWARASKSRPESQPRIQTTKFEKSFNKPAPQQAVLVGRSEWVLEDRVGRIHSACHLVLHIRSRSSRFILSFCRLSP